MSEKLNGLREKVKALFGKIGKKGRVLLIAAAAVIVGGAVLIALILNNRPYSVLVTDVNTDEASAILTFLEEGGVTNYRLENGNTILVPQGQEASLKAKLLMAGYPKSGYAYETYFGHAGMMSTESERDTIFLYDLQDRMAAVIRSMDGVKDAVVNITPGEDRTFVLTDNVVKASAFAMVTMRDGQKMSNQMAAAIRNLVARAVQGLEFDQISIVDSLGNTYSGGDGLTSALDASQLKLELEAEVNNLVRTEIMQALSPLYGVENVRVSVNSTVDISRSVGQSTTYTLPEGAVEGEGLLGKKVFENQLVRGGTDAIGGVVGTSPNSDLPNYVKSEIDNVGEDSTYVSSSGEEDHKLNESQQQVENVAGTVTDVMVAVSINSTTAGSVNTATLRAHVARAAGIGPEVEEDKISILSAPFYAAPGSPVLPIPGGIQLPQWAIFAAAGGAALLLFLLILITVLRRKRRRRKARQLEAMLEGVPMEAAQGLTPREGADIMNLKTEKSMELRKDIREFAESSPEIAAQMVRSWLKGEANANG